MIDESIEVTLGPTGGKKVFQSPNEVMEWLRKERAQWSWLLDSGWPVGTYMTVAAQFRTFFDSVAQLTTSAITEKSVSASQGRTSQLLRSILGNIANAFGNFYGKQGILSGTPKANLIEEVRTKYGNQAAACLCAVFFGVQLVPDQEAVRATILAWLYDRGLIDRLPTETKSLDDLRLEYQTRFNQLSESLQDKCDTQKGLNDQTRELLEEQKLGYQSQLDTAKAEWDKFKAVLSQELAMAEPVNYWKTKAKGHRLWAIICGATSAIAIAGAVAFLYSELQDLLQAPKGNTDKDWHPEYWRIAFAIAFALFAVWVIRVFVRLLLANLHLLTDARERQTMILTYLALRSGGHLEDDKDRRVILENLFRPTSTGIIKDDAIPLAAVEGAIKAVRD